MSATIHHKIGRHRWIDRYPMPLDRRRMTHHSRTIFSHAHMNEKKKRKRNSSDVVTRRHKSNNRNSKISVSIEIFKCAVSARARTGKKWACALVLFLSTHQFRDSAHFISNRVPGTTNAIDMRCSCFAEVSIIGCDRIRKRYRGSFIRAATGWVHKRKLLLIEWSGWRWSRVSLFRLILCPPLRISRHTPRPKWRKKNNINAN